MKMSRFLIVIVFVQLSLLPSVSLAQQEEVVDVSGISIIGNRELPKSLFIVPWKNADVGEFTELSDNLNEELRALDRDVFVREIDYYDFLYGEQ